MTRPMSGSRGPLSSSTTTFSCIAVIAGSVLRSRTTAGVARRLVPHREQKFVSASNAVRQPGQMIFDTLGAIGLVKVFDLASHPLPFVADLRRGLVGIDRPVGPALARHLEEAA